MSERHSVRCSNLKTRWNGTQCVLCINAVPPGREVTPNCGHDDEGGIHEPATRPCEPNTFNDGTNDFCLPCSSCPSGQDVMRPCNRTADTLCENRRSQPSPPTNVTEPPPNLPVSHNHMVVLWALSSILLVFALLAAVAFYMRWKRGRRWAESYNKTPSYVNIGFRNSELEGILNQTILAAPLQTVLDNLDVLEELVILLDPESRGIKNTKHLASLCSFSAAWVTYTYSMKESKSPLRAVLEGVASRNPDWTVGHLVHMLKRMERNDAIAALAKLRVNEVNF